VASGRFREHDYGGYLNDSTQIQAIARFGGGNGNSIGTNSDYCVIGGGINNIIASTTTFATIPGGEDNTATNNAFAAGVRARANHVGAFVWGDSTFTDIASTNAIP